MYEELGDLDDELYWDPFGKFVGLSPEDEQKAILEFYGLLYRGEGGTIKRNPPSSQAGDFGTAGWMEDPHDAPPPPRVTNDTPTTKDMTLMGRRNHQHHSYREYDIWLAIIKDIPAPGKPMEFVGEQPIVAARGGEWVIGEIEKLMDGLEVPLELRDGQTENEREFAQPIPVWAYAVNRKLQAVHEFSPGQCLYHATKTFLGNILGLQLDHTDNDYFLMFPYLEPGGTPMPYTAQAVQELIEPYGLRVSRIRINAGMVPAGDLREWMQYLGCNPLGAEDYRTTNAQYAEAVGMDPRIADQFFGFEFHTEPFRPGIVCEASKAHQFAKPLGHASFLAPRGRANDWWVSLQVDRTPWPMTAPDGTAMRPTYPLRTQQYVEVPDLHAIRKRLDDAESARKREAAKGGTTFLPTWKQRESTARSEVQQP